VREQTLPHEHVLLICAEGQKRSFLNTSVACCTAKGLRAFHGPPNTIQLCKGHTSFGDGPSTPCPRGSETIRLSAHLLTLTAFYRKVRELLRITWHSMSGAKELALLSLSLHSQYNPLTDNLHFGVVSKHDRTPRSITTAATFTTCQVS
jgi:hypothetical protein